MGGTSSNRTFNFDFKNLKGKDGVSPDPNNYKSKQAVVPDPSASGTEVSFISSISQNENGEITAAKKTVRDATLSASGLMSAADKKKLDELSDDTKCTSLTLTQGAATTPSGDTVEVIENKNITASGTGTSLSGTLTAVTVPTKEYTDKTFATLS
jgi:hypothetical protein